MSRKKQYDIWGTLNPKPIRPRSISPPEKPEQTEEIQKVLKEHLIVAEYVHNLQQYYRKRMKIFWVIEWKPFRA